MENLNTSKNSIAKAQDTFIKTIINKYIEDYIKIRLKEYKDRLKRFEDDFDKKYHSHYINFNEDNLNKVVTQFNQKQRTINAEISKTIDWETYYKGLNPKQKNDFLNDIVRQLFEDSDFLLDNEIVIKQKTEDIFEDKIKLILKENNGQSSDYYLADFKTAFDNALMISDGDIAACGFGDNEKEVIRNLYQAKVGDKKKRIYPPNSIMKIIVVANYDDIEPFLNKDKVFSTLMPPSDMFRIKTELKSTGITLYGYDDLITIDEKNIPQLSEDFRTRDNHLKCVMFIDNVNNKTFSVEDVSEEDIEESMEELEDTKYNDEMLNESINEFAQDTGLIRTMTSRDYIQLREMIYRYMNGYNKAIENLEKGIDIKLENDRDANLLSSAYEEENIDILKTQKEKDDENTYEDIQSDVEKEETDAPNENERLLEEEYIKDIKDIENIEDMEDIENVEDVIEEQEEIQEEKEYIEVIFIPTKNIMHMTPARTYIGVDDVQINGQNKTIIFGLNRPQDVYEYKGREYFEVKDRYYPYYEVKPSKKEISFTQSKEKVPATLLREKFTVVKKVK